jgi:hypothetical protein
MNAQLTVPSTPIVLQLDVTVAFEALILNELRRRPTARQAEWLRGLLVQGFLFERRALQAVQAAGATSITARDTRAAASTGPALAIVKGAVAEPPPEASAQEEPVPDPTDTTSPMAFAALRKVIG